MNNEKMVYVPRSWQVKVVDETGYEETVTLRANEEYRIKSGEFTHNITVAGVQREEDKTYIIPKIMMNSGYMNVMKKVTDIRFDLDNITSITKITSKYIKVNRSVKDVVLPVSEAGDDMYDCITFAFDTDKYTSQYHISIYTGEFVCLALKSNGDAGQRSRSIYGEIIGIDNDNQLIKFNRYVSNKGVRDAYMMDVNINSLLGIYRYELELADKVEEVIEDKE